MGEKDKSNFESVEHKGRLQGQEEESLSEEEILTATWIFVVFSYTDKTTYEKMIEKFLPKLKNIQSSIFLIGTNSKERLAQMLKNTKDNIVMAKKNEVLKVFEEVAGRAPTKFVELNFTDMKDLNDVMEEELKSTVECMTAWKDNQDQYMFLNTDGETKKYALDIELLCEKNKKPLDKTCMISSKFLNSKMPSSIVDDMKKWPYLRLEVKGAGTEAANGTYYREYKEKINEAPVFRRETQMPSCNTIRLTVG